MRTGAGLGAQRVDLHLVFEGQPLRRLKVQWCVRRWATRLCEAALSAGQCSQGDRYSSDRRGGLWNRVYYDGGCCSIWLHLCLSNGKIPTRAKEEAAVDGWRRSRSRPGGETDLISCIGEWGRGVRVQRSATNLKNPLLVELHIWWSFSWPAEDSSSLFPVSLSFLRPSLTLRLTLYSIYDLWPICPRTRGTTQHFRTPHPPAMLRGSQQRRCGCNCSQFWTLMFLEDRVLSLALASVAA